MNRFADLQVLIRHAVLFRSKNYFNCSYLVEEDVANPRIPVFGKWMTLIILAGGPLRITLKIHYKTTDIKNLGSKDGIDLSIHSSSFMKELCNLIAGWMKRKLDQNGLTLGISLPVSSHGFDEVFFPI